MTSAGTQATMEERQPFRLCNRVWDGGYEWVSLVDGRRVLVPSGAEEKIANTRAAMYRWNLRWELKEIPHICREFSQMQTESQIASFASRHGQLTRSISGTDSEVWAAAISDAHFWLETWDLVRERNTKKLKARIGFDSEFRWINTPDGRALIGNYLPAVHFPKSDVLKSAQFAVRDAVNERLERYPVGASLFVGSEELPGHSFELAFRASGLLAIIWMQIAQEVAGVYSFQECEFCRAPFYPKRKTARFCSDVCRATLWLQNKRQS